MIAEVKAAPGAFLAEGAAVLHIVDARRLWLEVRVAESDLGRLQAPDGAAFRIPGSERAWELDAGNSRLVAVGGGGGRRRAAPCRSIFEVTKPDPVLKVGMAVQAQVFAGEARRGAGGAGVRRARRKRHRHGVRAERRRVLRAAPDRKPGVRDGDWIEVMSGLRGRRTRGRPAAPTSSSSPPRAARPSGHGHAH
ncbi:MAG: HlyD family secretion protein [Comamonadaceae bacterium]|nr:HlyD family secretion protein [Comamonadaceae bacterium]